MGGWGSAISSQLRRGPSPGDPSQVGGQSPGGWGQMPGQQSMAAFAPMPGGPMMPPQPSQVPNGLPLGMGGNSLGPTPGSPGWNPTIPGMGGGGGNMNQMQQLQGGWGQMPPQQPGGFGQPPPGSAPGLPPPSQGMAMQNMPQGAPPAPYGGGPSQGGGGMNQMMQVGGFGGGQDPRQAQLAQMSMMQNRGMGGQGMDPRMQNPMLRRLSMMGSRQISPYSAPAPAFGQPSDPRVSGLRRLNPYGPPSGGAAPPMSW